MDPRVAAELLYESEATLRMVDTALEELRLADAELRAVPLPRAAGSRRDPESAELVIPSDFCVRAYWQVQEVLDGLQQSRDALRAAGTAPGRAAVEEERQEYLARIDGALAIVDRLDTLDEAASPAERATLHGELRRDLLALLNRTGGQTQRAEALSTVTSLLAEAEGRLTRLALLLDSGEPTG
jgi:hypothetical protein